VSNEIIKADAEVVVLPKATVTRKNKVRKDVLDTKRNIEDSYFRLGELLYEVHYGGYWQEWGYDDFDSYLMDEVGFHHRKGMYFISIYKKLLIEAQVPKEKLEGIGWSKAKEVARVATKENAEEWVEKARESTVTELVNEVRETKAEEAAGDTGEGKVERAYRQNFTLFESQMGNLEEALKVAGKVAESDKKGHLLDCICTSFLANVMEDQGEGRRVSEMMRHVQNIERVFGVKVIVMDPKRDKPIYGEEHAE
jgi:hypothetical protein